MPSNYPILRLIKAETAKRTPGTPGKPPKTSSTEVQHQRFGQTFERLRSVLGEEPGSVRWASDPEALGPGRPLVLELYGQVSDFAREARRVQLEWLLEDAVRAPDPLDDVRAADTAPAVETSDEESPDGDDLADDPQADKRGRLYVSMPSRQAYAELLALWDSYVSGEKAPPGFAKWWSVFATLSVIRSWGPQDRVEPETRSHFGADPVGDVDGMVTVEVDLWFRAGPEVRADRLGSFLDIVSELGGEILDEWCSESIHCQVALVRLPVDRIREILQLRGPVVSVDDIMLIRPQTSSLFASSDEVAPEVVDSPTAPSTFARGPRGLLLDGWPVENHQGLSGRIKVVQVDVDGNDVPVRQRRHGTQMASIILHGDIAANEASLDSQLLIVPVLAATRDGHERTPSGKLALGIVERAIEAVMTSENGVPAPGRDVVVVNHSLGDDNRRFMGRASPWARLLDHLAHKHRLLIVVSAGNCSGEFAWPDHPRLQDALASPTVGRSESIMLALEAARETRAMLNPAETMNGLTVGALHQHADPAPIPGFDPFPDWACINLSSSSGLGVNGTIKPDLVMPGGRQGAVLRQGAQVMASARHSIRAGVKAAVPDHVSGRMSLAEGCSGTSPAAALTTRLALQICEELDRAFEGEDEPWADRPTRAVLLKALLAHGCRWGDIGERLHGLLPPHGGPSNTKRREVIASLIGYGTPDPARIMDGNAARVTLLAEGEIKNDQRHRYIIPLPSGLISETHPRAITATLAWSSPVRPGARVTRAVALDLTDAEGKSDIWEGVERKGVVQPPHYSVGKGTLIHVAWSGSKAIPFASNNGFEIGVQARASTTAFNQMSVPYCVIR